MRNLYTSQKEESMVPSRPLMLDREPQNKAPAVIRTAEGYPHPPQPGVASQTGQVRTMASSRDTLSPASNHSTIQHSTRITESPASSEALSVGGVSHNDLMRELPRVSSQATNHYDAPMARIRYLETRLQTAEMSREGAFGMHSDRDGRIEASGLLGGSHQVSSDVMEFRSVAPMEVKPDSTSAPPELHFTHLPKRLHPNPTTSAPDMTSNGAVGGSIISSNPAGGNDKPPQYPRPLTKKETAAIEYATFHKGFRVCALNAQQYKVLQDVRSRQGSQRKDLCALTRRDQKLLQRSKKRELGQNMTSYHQLTEDEWETVQRARHQAGTVRAAERELSGGDVVSN